MSMGTFHPAEQPVVHPAGQPVVHPAGQPVVHPAGQPVVHPVLAGLQAASAGVESARQGDAWAACDDDLTTAIAECEALAARVAELELALVAEADDRDLGRRLGATSTAAWLRNRFRLRPGEAKARLTMAHRLRHTSDEGDDGGRVVDWAASVTGQAPRLAMPATGTALRTGKVSAEHARVISTVMSRLPTDADHDTVTAAESDLAGYATQFDPAALARLGEHLLHVLDPDGTLADQEATDYRKRELTLNDDTGTIRGRLDREGLAQLRTALDPLSAPCPAADGTPDPRTPARRTADALVELTRRTCDTGDLPSARGARPHLALIAELDTLQTRADANGSNVNGSGYGNGPDNRSDHRGNEGLVAPGGIAPGGIAPGELAFGGPISAEAVRRIACDAGISRIITDPAGVPLDVGREHRTVTPGQFAALVARDGGCAFPSCTRPASWCEAHHIRHWADGGPTSLDNMVLLCGHHHRTIHHHGWEVRLTPDRHPEFTPPAWIDPDQTPQRNTRPRYHRKRSP